MGAEEQVGRRFQGARMRREPGAAELELVRGSALFRGAEPEALHDVLQTAGELTVKRSELLLEAGERLRCVYLVLAGRLALCRDGDARIALAYVEPGECVGEHCLLDDEALAPAAVAVASSHILALEPARLWQLMEAQPRIARNMLQIVAARTRCMRERLGEGYRPCQLPHTDATTGLHNRRWLSEMFVRQIDRCERARQPVCIALVDLDRFRSVNENYGHQAGDRVLSQVARVIRRQLRPSDLVVRYGGEEFACLLPDTELHDAVAALERLRLAIASSQTALAQRATIRCSVSIGVVAWRDGWSLEQLLCAAEHALARAKEAGRNRVLAYEDLSQET
jgi:diguanylate cyclase (GGDEF)-like protein